MSERSETLLDGGATGRRVALAALVPADHVGGWVARELVGADEDATVRAEAARALERLGTAGRDRVWILATEQALTDAVYDTHASVRANACRALGRRRATSASSLLARVAIEEPIWWVRRAALLAVARIDRAAAVPVLDRCLDDPFWRVRHAAARTLAAIGAADPERVASVLAEGRGASERADSAARWVAGRLGLPVRPFAGDRSPASGSSTADTGGLADPDPAVVTARLEAGAAASAADLTLYVGDPHEALRRAARVRLLESEDPRALLAAALWLEDPRIPHATATVVALLDAFARRSAAFEELLDLALVLTDADERPGTRSWAISHLALAERWDRAAAIFAAAGSSEVLVRRTALAALGSLAASRDPDVRATGTPEDAVPVLARALADDPDDDAHRVAAHGLLQAGALEPLLARTFGEEPALVRRLLVTAADAADALDVLRTAATDEDAATRAAATAALHRRGALSGDRLAVARASEDPWLRAAALDGQTALDVLAGDASPFVRRDAFARIPSSERLAAARIAAAADDVGLRIAGTERLVRSLDDEDLRRVLRLTRDPEIAVRAAAADALVVGRDLPARLASLTIDPEDTVVREAAETWLGIRAPALIAEARANVGLAPVVAVEPPAPLPSERRVCAVPLRRLGRSGIAIAPLVVSGAYEPSVGSLFGAFHAGVNAFFWEPRYRNLTTFLRNARDDGGARPLVIAGTYHATERAIRADVRRALRRLRREQLDVFLVFWTRSPARLEGEVARALTGLVADGLVRAAGFSTHDRALAARFMGEGPWSVAMVRHSAAHPGAEETVFPEARARDVGVLSFSATSYGRLLRRRPDGGAPPTAADCYGYSLAQPGVTACLSAPRGGAELRANLEVLGGRALDPARLAALREVGRDVREESLDFARFVRRFPAVPSPRWLDALEELEAEDLAEGEDATLASDDRVS